MAHENTKARLIKLHEQWQQEESELPFKVFVSKNANRLFAQLRRNPAVLNNLTFPIQRDWKAHKSKKIGKKTLEKHMPDLTRIFLEDPQGQTLQDFLKNVLDRCQTERELRTYISQSS